MQEGSVTGPREAEFVRTLGQMSGTSADGVDLAIIETDGRHVRPEGGAACSYRAEERQLILDACRVAQRTPAVDLRDARRWPTAVREADEAVTAAHERAIRQSLRGRAFMPQLVGYHGQTLVHRPAEGVSLQVGNPERLEAALQLPFVAGLRQADMAAGGEGAPLAPFFHHAVAREMGLAEPVAFLNLGGVGNVTLVDPRIAVPEASGAVQAFDTGPGCALLDEWAEMHGAGRQDEDGRLALAGRPCPERLARLLEDPWFARPPPKSLDRGAFSLSPVLGLSAADGAATLVAMTSRSVAIARRWLRPPPARWLVCGGGRRNPAVLAALRAELPEDVDLIERHGWDGDLLEAQAFAYLALRLSRGLDISAPSTTGRRPPARPCG